MIGKWHLGSDPVGFDRWEIFPGQGVYFDPELYTAAGEKTYTGQYATDVVTDRALAFLRERPRDRPFFLMMHHKAPHRPWEPTAAQAARFAPRRIPEPVTFWDSYATRTDALRENQQRIAADLTNNDLKLAPPAGLAGPALDEWRGQKPDSVTVDRAGSRVTLTGEALVRWKYQRYMQDYLATVQSVDDSVGRVLSFLDEQGLARDTLVIYTSDQGFFLGDHGLFDKRFMYEESIRMPFLVRWPGVIRPGTRSDALALNVDFAPTFLDAAGLPSVRGDAGTEPPARAARRDARRLAHVDVLPLLPRPGTPQHARASGRAHAHAQADPLLEEGPVGALRPREGPARGPQPLRRAGPRGAHGVAEGGAGALEARARGRGPARRRPAPAGRRRPGGAAAGEVMSIVSLLPAATEIVCALGLRDRLVGRSHECDFPAGVDALPALTRARVDSSLPSAELDAQVRQIVADRLPIYVLDDERMGALAPEVVVTQEACEVCAIAYDQVVESLQRTAPRARVVSLQPRGSPRCWATCARWPPPAACRSAGSRSSTG